ncbi:MAG: DUF1963 domain-containing protein [Pseudomonadota bacterium]
MFTTIAIILGMIVAAVFIQGLLQGRQEALAEEQAKQSHKAHVTQVKTQIKDLLDLQKTLAQPGVAVTIRDDIATNLLDSRIGGNPAWPKGTPKPQPKGQFPFYFLAQINFAEMPKLDGFPSTGLLQFFAAADDLYGVGFQQRDADGVLDFNSDIHIAYHDTLDTMEEWVMFASADDVATLDVPFDYRDWWRTGYRLEFGPARSIRPTFDDYRLYDAYWDIEKQFTNKTAFSEITDPYLEQTNTGADMMIGGHPFFSQIDPRYDYDVTREFSHCLLSIDSTNGKFLWGDCGTGSFLIRPDDLRRRDFGQVLSNYDCL